MLTIFFAFCCLFVNHSLAQFDPTQHENWKLLQNRNCDDRTASRIIGGTRAKLGEFPWIVYFVFRRPDGRRTIHRCSGSILNKRTILTAAHCFDDLYALSLVVLGDWDKKSVLDCDGKICSEPAQAIKPSEIIIHSGYGKMLHHDIALIRLAKDIQFNSYVWPICMLNGHLMQTTFIGYEAIAAGWGAIDFSTNKMSSILLKVNLRVQDNEHCDTGAFVADYEMCVTGLEERQSVCRGDSGGPLMIVDDKYGHPHYYIIGIVSHSLLGGDRCGGHGFPEIFTRVSAYVEWILDNLVENKRDFTVV